MARVCFLLKKSSERERGNRVRGERGLEATLSSRCGARAGRNGASEGVERPSRSLQLEVGDDRVGFAGSPLAFIFLFNSGPFLF